MDALVEAGITPREAGEQVAAAFNGVETGEVRNGIRRRAVTVRLAGDENTYTAETVNALILSGRGGKRVRLDEVARVIPEDAPNLLLREGGRRKALISCNPAPGVDTGRLVEKIRTRLAPLAADAGCTLSFGGSYEARESAARRLAILGLGLLATIFFLLVLALGSARAACLALLNVPLALTGSVVAVVLADPVLSVSSLVGFITVIGFTLRNGILLLNCYRDHEQAGADRLNAIREGSLERMAPIILTSLTTVIGLIPIMLAGNTPGGELLAPLAVVQFGGLIGATLLNLVVLPAAALLFGSHESEKKRAGHPAALTILVLLALGVSGCQNYTPAPINWESEWRTDTTNHVHVASPDDAARLALVGNREINALRLKAARSHQVAQASGWWEDPSLDFDLMRILKPTDHPFLGGGALTFTIPLSGSLQREKRAADAYAAADRAKILAAEHALAAEARKTAVRLAALQDRTRILNAFETDPRIMNAQKNVDALHDAGEISAPERATMRRAQHARRHHLMELARETAETEIALLRLTGLRPGTKLTLAFTPEPPRTAPPAVDVRALIRHPDVVAACAELKGAEAALDAEIRRQYPDLKLGPAYANEEGLDRLGFTAGLTVPLWNRNRKNIAEATGVRDETRLKAIDAWRTCVCDAAAAHAALTHLLDHPAVPAAERRTVDALADAGELTPLDYLTVREEILEQQLAEADWRRDASCAKIELSKFQ
jgi:outer membrane protein TolC